MAIPSPQCGDSVVTMASSDTGYYRTIPMNQIMAEPDEFREFIVWMCGFTDATDAPDEEAWEKLRERVKEVAAKYVLARRDNQAAIDENQRQMELDLAMQGNTTTYSINSVTSPTPSSAKLTGNGLSRARKI